MSEPSVSQNAVRLLTVVDLADLVGVPVNTIYQWRHRGYGPKGMKIGKHVRFRAEDVDKWLEAQLDEERLAG